ncbi:MAG TPA: PTS IIA-like nitrogen regulatory protein PtsN [Caulobacteraceae bacterium]|jgi:PTS system nitrogen regulatory IIA component|nr:PTS IIA-like nitrogen regulatory protein PtsN [Caulobacteraceae bacterium]
MDIGELLDRASIAVRVNASSKRQALATAAEIAGRRLKVKPQVILDALLEREAQGSTGVGQGVAVPHARLPDLDRLSAVFLKLEQPIAFDAVDDRPVDLMCVLLAPKDAGVEHLRALARISRTLRQGELREQIRHARSADAVYALMAGDSRSNAA